MKRILIVSLLFSLSSYAQTSIEDCVRAGEQYGSQRKIPTIIPTSCRGLVLDSKKTYNHHQTDDLNIAVTGFKNLLYTSLQLEDPKTKLLQNLEHVISGEKSRLTNILAVKINQADQKVYVLNRDQNNFSIYSYFYNIGGNITPARKLITQELFNATNFRIDNTTKELYVVSKTDGWLKIFNREADPQGLRAENSIKLKRTISGINSLISNPVDIAISETEIFILDNDQVFVFDKNEIQITSPKRIIAGENSQLNGAKYIVIKDDKLIITNKDDKFYQFDFK